MFNGKIDMIKRRLDELVKDHNAYFESVNTRFNKCFDDLAECIDCGCLVYKNKDNKVESTICTQCTRVAIYGGEGYGYIDEQKEYIKENYRCKRCRADLAGKKAVGG